ncbi:uncharacterized protein LOC118754652 [Rhagoletis pomonella]|uniref:uncharacterized protein LOC118754652 n=1 Tax=Rhagoletis pomonella TaxID=28610 RepID=UPI00177F691A|nr:uncharacterized protein LOC118754652 [Rhagoletis pomonella]
MEEQDSEDRVVVAGLGLLDSNRRVTRSVARALENQVVGSIFTQIDTGIQHPVDFLPTDYLNRCAARIFGTSNQEVPQQPSVRVTNELFLNATDNSLTFSRKIEELFNMSEEEQQTGGSMPLNDQGPGGSKSHSGGPSSAAINVEQLSRMMAMMAQQNDMMAQCMNEVRHMRDNVVNLNSRVAEVETSMQGTRSQPARASTPEERRETSTTEHGPGAEKPPSQSHSRKEASYRKKIDLDKWHVKFDGSAKGLTIESFIFRIEKMREQYDISYYQLFTDFHCLVTGSALKWYWQVLEDHADEPDFGYVELKTELLNHFKSAESDYEIIREIMERKQAPQESFEEFYSEVHDLTFRLRKKIPEQELVGIIRGNLKPYLANVTFASRMESLAELKSECRRAEKVMRENRSRSKAVNELNITGVEKSENLDQNYVEAFGRPHHDKPQQPVQARDKLSSSVSPNVQKPSIRSFCPSPFHLMLCFSCGMPVDYFVKNPSEENKCKSSFHNMLCFACGSDASFCVFKPNQGNVKVAEISGNSRQGAENPEPTQ